MLNKLPTNGLLLVLIGSSAGVLGGVVSVGNSWASALHTFCPLEHEQVSLTLSLLEYLACVLNLEQSDPSWPAGGWTSVSG